MLEYADFVYQYAIRNVNVVVQLKILKISKMNYKILNEKMSVISD